MSALTTRSGFGSRATGSDRRPQVAAYRLGDVIWCRPTDPAVCRRLPGLSETIREAGRGRRARESGLRGGPRRWPLPLKTPVPLLIQATLA